ncbi:undecaprenyl-phosphate glucose phosphotransferase, partial [Psychromonas sp.]|nr:undecaprenyl-phosphate glucose phosphotransferase [Psychromonas sp.]
QALTTLYSLIGLIAVIAFSLAAETLRLYRSWRTGYPSLLVTYTFLSWISAIFVVSIFLFFSKSSVELSRLVIGFWFVATTMVLIGWRLIFRVILFKRRRSGLNTRKVAIIGLTESGVRLATEFAKHPEIGFSLKAFFDDRDNQRLPTKFRNKLEGNIKKRD